MPRFRPCPHCGIAKHVKPVAFTWWGGPIGPRILSHVKCRRCGLQFNGRTGQSNTNWIIAYTAVCLTVVFVVGMMLIR